MINNLANRREKYINLYHPQRATILAAGYGLRMVPINTEEPKGLLEVKREPLIERIIKQLHKVGITDISIVVGFMKEHYEYLIDQYNIKLIVNTHYSTRNNIYSLYLAKDRLENGYIIPCDIWFKNNPFSTIEGPSWYLFSDKLTSKSNWIVSKSYKVRHTKDQLGNRMIGIAYLNKADADKLVQRMSSLIRAKKYDLFWEDALAEKDNFLINGRIIPNSEHAEINSYEELLELDSNSSHLENEAIQIIENTFKIDKSDIHNIHTLKKGMTNRSFIFTVKDKRYIMRIPGTGTDKLINRQEEYDVYEQIRDEPYTERVLYLNPKNGYKLSEFLEGTRNSKADSWQDVTKCMNLLRKFHQQKHSVNHKFDIWKKVEFYDTLRNAPSAYRDFLITKDNVLKLKPFIENNISNWTLCHIDANADNFLINKEGKTFLIDWEYAGMQDPDLDIAMFAIYAGYSRDQFDKLIDIYYQDKCDEITRYKIYAYAAVGGLLWSNWCEYKQSLGLDFGEYSLSQYRYAKEYSKLVLNYLREKNA
ncbi:MAG TPA: phosphotransferase [Candidatus Coprosoma intestinipullorum]|uniref:Phosphotransferase n=1 Tax=Candidatus Coprosoma intestinipullorum TaxID=2840752 RepID=A0A9D0ZRL1_9FIRM|nr:phosphotransferase [Candidatus Coprosoma intestinipullorum]